MEVGVDGIYVQGRAASNGRNLIAAFLDDAGDKVIGGGSQLVRNGTVRRVDLGRNTVVGGITTRGGGVAACIELNSGADGFDFLRLGHEYPFDVEILYAQPWDATTSAIRRLTTHPLTHTQIGPGVKAVSGMATQPITGTIFASTGYGDGGKLYTLHPATGQLTLVGDPAAALAIPGA